MNKYFNLYSHCVPVNGQLRSTLYNFNEETVFHLKEKESIIINRIINGQEIKEIKKDIDGDIVDEFINLLIEKSMGEYSNNFLPRETYRKGAIKNLLKDENIPMQNCFIELPCECTKNCVHCDDTKINGCYSCKRATQTAIKELGFYYNLMRDIVALKFKNLYFHGGDPLLEWEFTKEILHFTSLLTTNEQNIFIQTNGSLLDNDKVKFMLDFNITPIINIDFTSDNSEDILQMVKSIKTIVHNFNENHKNVIVNVLFSTESLKDFKLIYEKLHGIGVRHIIPSVLINSLDDKVVYHQYLPVFTKDINTFSYLGEYHPCLAGTLAVGADKKVYPCPRMHEEPLMDLENNERFLDLFDEKANIMKYWKLSLEKIEPCSKCEFRRMCGDCRAAEMEFSKDLTKKTLCSYV
ncbi:radical SAM protein [Bacillus sp. AFS018417]|uniref:radical SAM/SPASM domain-containing protein n=1 Tax=Bacillus sp. AFS018417 TaxID=2033491 RepID=UPI0020D2091F|nr:radical SAM protein [Bacillus sp. AFS018417]